LWTGGAAALAVVLVLALSHAVQRSYAHRIVPLSEAPRAPVALVLGPDRKSAV